MKEVELKDRQKVEVPIDHLHPQIQDVIMTHKGSIYSARKLRRESEIAFILTTALGIREKEPMYAPLTAFFGLSRTAIAKIIQLRHKTLQTLITENGLLHPDLDDETRQNYESWSKPEHLAKTHPIFYVKANGNIVFVKNSRMEYYRYQAQQRLPGKVGIHPWRWRGYLTPPEAPESVKTWAKAKVAKLKEKLAIEPAPIPAPSRVKLR